MTASMDGPPLVAFLGKGGTGKTTLAALFLRHALAAGPRPILVVDADPNPCLADLIALPVPTTVGSIKRLLLDKKDELSRASISKTEYCGYALENAVVECTGFDMVVMGRPDGEGCYCFVNGIVHALIQRMKRSYRLVIADCEAGLEHLSRKTLGELDTAVIVSDPSRKGVETAIRQVALMKEVSLTPRRTLLVFNNTESRELPRELAGTVREAGVSVAGAVRHDPLVMEYERAGRSLMELPEDSVSLGDVRAMMDFGFETR
jgi:CO dehydrogenase maturation factor